jgi:hypothetical protein
VSTILSSYLIYNSVKIIDQGDIDYLDLLARRTRLFALRSQITKSKWFDEFNHDLLHFPPLIWVIQDFVQTTDDFETPQDWLHRIMTSSSRESEEHNINLLSMFESVNCHTLFLPATKKALLQDLSTATEMDLTPEYKEERDSLLKLIKSKLKPKVKNGKVITGPELASLLEILVAAANEGSLAEVPSRWNAFLEQMHLGSVEDCIRYYESEINVLLKKQNFEAINATELLLWHQVSLEKSEDLLDKLLFGMQNESFKTKLKLIKSCNEKYEKIRDINEKKIELRCGEAQRKIEIEVVEYFEDMTYPIKKKKMSSIFNDAKEKFSEDYILEVGYLSDHSSYDTYLNLLMISIDRIFNGVKLKNNEAMEIILKAAINKAIDVFRTESRNVNEIPRTTQIIKEVIDKANGEAKKVFELESSVTHDEDVYQLYVKYYQSEIDTEAGKVREENLQLVHGKCANKIVELEKTYRENTSPRKLTFPLNESYLEARLKEESDTIYKAYAESLAEFNDMSPFFDVQRQLVDKVHGICDERRDQNYKAYIKEVETPLQTAVKLIKLTSDKYDTEFSFQYYMEQVCLLHLDEGKASSWSLSLKKSIIRRYISSHKELQELLSNKAGLWSRVKGFFQWIYSLIF